MIGCILLSDICTTASDILLRKSKIKTFELSTDSECTDSIVPPVLNKNTVKSAWQ